MSTYAAAVQHQHRAAAACHSRADCRQAAKPQAGLANATTIQAAACHCPAAAVAGQAAQVAAQSDVQAAADQCPVVSAG